MTFRIRGLDPELFAPWFALSDVELAARGARRSIADKAPGFPCRVSMADAEVGDELVLVPYEHHAVASPYRASGPIYVRRTAHAAFAAVDEVPRVLARRLLAVRAYDADATMCDADVCDGGELAMHLSRVFADARVAYVHVHYAKPGCFACRVDRA